MPGEDAALLEARQKQDNLETLQEMKEMGWAIRRLKKRVRRTQKYGEQLER